MKEEVKLAQKLQNTTMKKINTESMKKYLEFTNNELQEYVQYLIYKGEYDKMQILAHISINIKNNIKSIEELERHFRQNDGR